MSIENKLQELGIILPHPAKPAGSYKPCVMVDNIAYISGQGPVKLDGSQMIGKVGKDLSAEEGKLAARQVGLTMLATIKQHFKQKIIQRQIALHSQQSPCCTFHPHNGPLTESTSNAFY